MKVKFEDYEPYFEKVGKVLCTFAKQNNNLFKIDLSENENNIGAMVFELFKEEQNYIRELVMDKCRLGHYRLKPILKAIGSSAQLFTLQMERNHFKHQNGEDFRQFISAQKSFKQLKINNNDLEAAGLLQIIQGITESQSSLDLLDLSQNHIDFDQWPEGLSDLILHHKIRKINFSHNKFRGPAC